MKRLKNIDKEGDPLFFYRKVMSKDEFKRRCNRFQPIVVTDMWFFDVIESIPTPIAPHRSSNGVPLAALPLEQWIRDQLPDCVELESIHVTHTPQLVQRFKGHMGTLQYKRSEQSHIFNFDFTKPTPFDPSPHTSNDIIQARLKCLHELKQRIETDGFPLTPANILLLWHGSQGEDVIDSIMRGGVASLARGADEGYFGKGIYLTPQPGYAVGYSSGMLVDKPDPETGDSFYLLLSATVIGQAYPVTIVGDYNPPTGKHGGYRRRNCKLYGQPLLTNPKCDAHYAQITVANNYHSAHVPGHFDFEEIVVSEVASVLPFAKVKSK